MDNFVEVPCKNDFKAFIVDKGRVLSLSAQKRIDEIWDHEFQLRQGKLFNGSALGVIDVSENEILVERVEYKLVLASLRDPSLAKEVDFKSLCTSGMTLSDGKVLLGQRSQYVSSYPNSYEFVPSGTIDAPDNDNIIINLRDQLINELTQEAEIEEGFIEETAGWTIVYDATTKIYEVVARITVKPFFSSSPFHKANDEYRLLLWLGKDEFEKHLIQHSDHYVPLTKYLYTKWMDFISN